MMTKALIRIRRSDEVRADLQAMGERFSQAWANERSCQPLAILTFESPAQLFSVLSPKRWELVEQLQRLGPSSLRGLARSLERDVKRVHEDVALLIDWGLVERNEAGLLFVPYEEIEADFVLKASAA
jgi:predicted transcriptional regulator